MYLSEELQKKWQPVLEHPELNEIQDPYKKAVTTVVLENQEKALREEKEALFEATHANQTGAGVDNYDPILISLVRRALPNLMAYDVCGVQPMSGPTGLIFAMKSHYSSQTGTEALFNPISVIINYFDVEKLNKNLFLGFNIPKSRGSVINYKKRSKILS